MNISTLTPEQQAGFASLLSNYNATTNQSLTAEQYQDVILLGVIDAEVSRLYQAAVAMLGSGAAQAPYDQRVAQIGINLALNAKPDNERAALLAQIQALL